MIIDGSPPEKVIRNVRQKYGVDPRAIKPLRFPCPPAAFEDVLLRARNGTKLDVIDPNEVQDAGILVRGFYSQQLRRYLAAGFERQQMHILLTEELFSNFVNAIDDVQAFLGLPYFNYTPLVHVNERGFTVLEGMKSKADKLPYSPITPKAKEVLDRFYASSIRELTRLVEPERLLRHWGPPVVGESELLTSGVDRGEGMADDADYGDDADDDADDDDADDDDTSQGDDDDMANEDDDARED